MLKMEFEKAYFLGTYDECLKVQNSIFSEWKKKRTISKQTLAWYTPRETLVKNQFAVRVTLEEIKTKSDVLNEFNVTLQSINEPSEIFNLNLEQ
jgi:hypothetical protein